MLCVYVSVLLGKQFWPILCRGRNVESSASRTVQACRETVLAHAVQGPIRRILRFEDSTYTNGVEPGPEGLAAEEDRQARRVGQVLLVREP